MGILVLSIFAVGCIVGIAGGILILGYPMRRRQPTLRELGYCSVICLVLSGIVFIISREALSLSQSSATSSLLASAQQAFAAFGAMGFSIGLGLTGFVGLLELAVAATSQKK